MTVSDKLACGRDVFGGVMNLDGSKKRIEWRGDRRIANENRKQQEVILK